MDDRDRQQLLAAFGREVRQRREALGRSQEALAAEVGVHRTYLGAIERGERNPSLWNLSRIASGLRCPLSGLLASSEERLQGVPRSGGTA